MKPFDLEVWYGERVAVLGSNGSGKSHFLRLLARGGSDPDVEHRPSRTCRSSRSGTPARPSSVPGSARAGSCRPTSTPSWSAAPCWRSCTAATAARTVAPGMGREQAARVLDRYELAHASEQRFESLSGGQQARFQILLLELSGATLLLLDEPTDNLDVQSAEALEAGLEAFDGHRGRGHPRPLVRPRLRPLPRLRRGRRGLRDRGAGVGRGPGAADPMTELRDRRRRPVRPGRLRAVLRGLRRGARGTARVASSPTVWQLDEVRVAMADPDERTFRHRLGRAGWTIGAVVATGWMQGSTVDNTDLADVLVCCAPRRARPRVRRRRCSPTSRSRPARAAGTGWWARSSGPTPAAPTAPGRPSLAWARRQGFELGLVDVQRRLALPVPSRAARRPGRRGRRPPRGLRAALVHRPGPRRPGRGLGGAERDA